MAQSWSYDAPTGVYKNRDLSAKLRMAAIAETKFMQFVTPVPGYGKKKGESVTFTRLSNVAVPTNGRLAENARVPEDEIVLTTVAVTVTEWGRSIPYTSLADDLGMFDMEQMIQKQLRNQMSLVLDKAASAAFKTGRIKATPTGSSTLLIGTNGVAPGTASVNLNFYHIEQIRDYMFSSLNIAGYEGDEYICLLSTKAKRGLMQDSAFVSWNQFKGQEKKFKSEIGVLEGIRFIEINNANALSGSLGTSGVMGEAVFFGDDAVSMAVAQDPELRAAPPQDFGRIKSVAWYGILEFLQVWGDSSNPGEAKVVHLTSL